MRLYTLNGNCSGYMKLVDKASKYIIGEAYFHRGWIQKGAWEDMGKVGAWTVLRSPFTGFSFKVITEEMDEELRGTSV